MKIRSLLIFSTLVSSSGCARDRGQITPTTTGTDLRAMPRGRMTPLPFPGSSLARSVGGSGSWIGTIDREAATASVTADAR